MLKYLILFILPLFSLFAGSVKLYNDTPFDLIASVQAANGQELGQQEIPAGQQSEWTDDHPLQLDVPYNENASITPYIVVWQCKTGGIFSICYNVPPGGIVSASICQGQHYCPPKKKTKDGQEQQSDNNSQY